MEIHNRNFLEACEVDMKVVLDLQQQQVLDLLVELVLHLMLQLQVVLELLVELVVSSCWGWDREQVQPANRSQPVELGNCSSLLSSP